MLARPDRSCPVVAAYVDGVLAGRAVVGKYVRKAVDRYVRDLETGAARGLRFDVVEAQLAIDFIEMLQHSKGQWAGQPIVLEGWQAFIVWNLFGWKKADGTRRYNVGLVLVARKNGKSTLGAAIAHKLFVADDEPGAEVYAVATKLKQAKIVHDEGKRMARKSPCLAGLVTILKDAMVCESTNSVFRPLEASPDTNDGYNISGAIVDELHAHKTRAAWDVVETATGSRRNPLILAISTAAASTDPESVYADLKSYSQKVLDGIVDDDSWFAFLCLLDDGDDWSDEAVWPKANPNLGVSVTIADLRRKCAKAKQSPQAAIAFRVKHCNQDVAARGEPWIPIDEASDWGACAGGDLYDGEGLRAEAIARLAGRPCWVAGDLSSVSDLTCLEFAFPDLDLQSPTLGCVDLVSFGWCPRQNAVARNRDSRVPYLAFAEEKQLFLTEGNSVDYSALRGVLKKARDEWKWDIREIVFDPNNARYLITLLTEEDGFPPEAVIEHLQTCGHMNDPIGAVEKLILDRKLRHGGHKLLRWCVSNVVIYRDTGGRRRFDKRHAREKMDLAVGMAMAVGRALIGAGQPDAGKSVYNKRGIITL